MSKVDGRQIAALRPLYVLGRKVKNKIGTADPLTAYRAMSNNRRMLPTFVIVGAMKAGTTFLHNVLTQHPEVRGPKFKEMHFFDRQYSRGETWYRAYFPHKGKAANGKPLITGDSTPNYMFHPPSPGRMGKLLPDAKIIVLVREPAARALSHYKMNVAWGNEDLTFQQAIEQEEQRLAGQFEKFAEDPEFVGMNYRRFSYKRRGHYLEQIKMLEEFYPMNQILVVDSKTLFSKTDEALASVEDFIGISQWKPAEYKAENVAKVKADVDEETMAGLREYFRPLDAELFDHLGWQPRW